MPCNNMYDNEQQVFSAYILNYFLKLVPYKHFSDSSGAVLNAQFSVWWGL